MPSNVLPLRLKQIFPPIIWIFTEGEGDEIESRLPFKIFSTLLEITRLYLTSRKQTQIQLTLLAFSSMLRTGETSKYAA